MRAIVDFFLFVCILVCCLCGVVWLLMDGVGAVEVPFGQRLDGWAAVVISSGLGSAFLNGVVGSASVRGVDSGTGLGLFVLGVLKD